MPPHFAAMIGPADYHMHTALCRHASGTPTEYAAHARSIGLQEIGFSDHAPMPRDDFDDWRMRADQLDQYVDLVRQAQRDHPDLPIKLALEIDYLPGQEDWLQHLASRYPWDYLIGSVHYVSDSWAVDNPTQISEWKSRDPWDVWSAYFDRLIQAAESGFFDIIGHADLPKKFGIVPKQDCAPLYERFLQSAQRRGVAVELNTAGLRKDCREIYPGESFCRLMQQHDVPITFGSDAHAASEVGLGWPEAVALARRCGFHHWLRFSGRQAERVSL